MSEKRINSRVILKHAIEEDWKKSSLVPLEGEIIIYDPDENYSYIRYKRGDGNTAVNSLPFEPYLHIGTEAPANPPVGMLWLDTSGDIKLIKFYIDTNNYGTLEYTAEENMTFRTWADSKYNTDNWRCSLEYEPTPEGDHIFGITQDDFGLYVGDSATITDCDSIIIANNTYSTSGMP
jgi:hypothetical protein